ncbi:MAG: MBL fold metallo-hydrolase [Candidatus Aenigmarchaeota archaeon]|nr:MBL fold metallo-hydrolase [Candidatus Aenigmarchaeota archaeon]
MQSTNRLVFLGTGGGKNVMFTQARKTGGIYIELDNVKMILDPGPGSLVNARKLKLHPERWNALLLSHLHPDHATDANVYLDGMQEAVLVAEEHCVLQNKKWQGRKYDYYPCISLYHRNRVKEVHAVVPKDKVTLGPLALAAVKTDHYDPTVGFRIDGSRSIGYAADGTYYKGQEKRFDGCNVLILNVLVPKGVQAKKHWHMGVDDAVVMVRKMRQKPKLVVIQHFSFLMLRNDVRAQAKHIEKETGVRTIAAEDFMEINLDGMEARGT